MTLDELAHKHGVASFDLSKALEKAGMPQDKSYFIWVEHPETTHPTEDGLWYIGTRHHYPPEGLKQNLIYLSAFNATELADVLKNHDRMPVWDSYAKKWLKIYRDNNVIEDTLPNILAKMVLYLLDKGIIKL